MSDAFEELDAAFTKLAEVTKEAGQAMSRVVAILRDAVDEKDPS